MITRKVTKVNAKYKPVTIMTKGEEVTFSAKNLKGSFPPEIGRIVDVFCTQTTPGGPLEATTVRGSSSDTPY